MTHFWFLFSCFYLWKFTLNPFKEFYLEPKIKGYSWNPPGGSMQILSASLRVLTRIQPQGSVENVFIFQGFYLEQAFSWPEETTHMYWYWLKGAQNPFSVSCLFSLRLYSHVLFPLLSSEPGVECWKNRFDSGRRWNGRLHPLWPVAGPHKDVQVGDKYKHFFHFLISIVVQWLVDWKNINYFVTCALGYIMQWYVALRYMNFPK